MKGMHKFIQVSGRLPERSTRTGLMPCQRLVNPALRTGSIPLNPCRDSLSAYKATRITTGNYLPALGAGRWAGRRWKVSGWK